VASANNYDDFLSRKSASSKFDGIAHGPLGEYLFPHQRDLVSWSLRKGRSALFADTGLGKSLMELEWARMVPGRVLILTPLAVAEQIVREGQRFGIDCAYLRADDGTTRIAVTNYEMLQHFDPAQFAGVVLDESSILKNFNGRTRDALIAAFSGTPYRLAATATPAPNDTTELGNHSEFLGIKTRTEMLAEYFVHDGETTQEWRIKGHATEAFWRWVCTWGAVVKTPADLGHDGSAFALPPLRMHEVIVDIEHRDAWSQGYLLAPDVRTLQDQRATRRATMEKRVAAAAALAGGSDPVLVWGELNDECDAVTAAIPGAVQIRGSDDPDVKSAHLLGFADGAIRVLVTKAKIAGFGLNFQRCARMVFLGASHSYEQTYQAIRRCWRFGQRRPVDVHVIRAETEGAVVANYRRKEADAERFSAEMSSRVRELVRAEVAHGTAREWNSYEPRMRMAVPAWASEDGR
jgi:superfamily II DNA or RNA helicase